MYVEKAEQKEPAISSCGFYEVIGRGGPPDAPSAIRRQGRCLWPCLSFTILCSAKLCLEIVAAHNYCTTYRSAAPPPAAPDADRRHSSSQLPIKFESPVYLLPHGALFILRLRPRLSAHRRDAAHRLPNLLSQTDRRCRAGRWLASLSIRSRILLWLRLIVVFGCPRDKGGLP